MWETQVECPQAGPKARKARNARAIQRNGRIAGTLQPHTHNWHYEAVLGATMAPTCNASAMGRNASAMGAMGAMGGQCVLCARNGAMRPQ